MNIALENTEEFINGEFKNRYGDAFIRGNNGTPPYALFTACSEIVNTFYFLHLVLYIRAAKA